MILDVLEKEKTTKKNINEISDLLKDINRLIKSDRLQDTTKIDFIQQDTFRIGQLLNMITKDNYNLKIDEI